MDIDEAIKTIRYQIDAIECEMCLAEVKTTELKGKKSALLWALKVLESDE